MIDSKKAQTEMIGLVIIVILLTLGMLFLAQFALRDHPEKKIFTRKGLAYSTMSAMMKTTITDPHCIAGFVGQSYPQMGKDIIEDCAVNYQTSPEGYSLYRCEGKHSCTFALEQITWFLNSTLGQWNKNYEFNSHLIVPSSRNPVPLATITVKGGCPKTKDRDSSGGFFIQTDAGLVESELYLCD